MLTLSMGLNGRVPLHLGQWMGSTGQWIGETVIDTNRRLYAFPGIGQIRFPMRWLIPSALMFFVGASYGLRRLYTLSFVQKRKYAHTYTFFILHLLCAWWTDHLLTKFSYRYWVSHASAARGTVCRMDQKARRLWCGSLASTDATSPKKVENEKTFLSLQIYHNSFPQQMHSIFR